jgi:hypothetical protein
MLQRLIPALALFAAAQAFAATQGGPIPVPLPLFPANNWWNTDISAAPVDPNSSSFITHVNTDPNTGNPVTRRVHPDWGGDNGDGTLYGFPYIIVDGSQPKVTVTFDPEAADECDGVGVPFYPIPDEAIDQYGWIEQGPPGNQAIGGDRHMLIVDKTNNELYELYNVFYDGTSWSAYSGAKFFMNTNNRRTEGWTSADASGMAMLPGLIRYDEVYGPNEITHAFRFTVRDTNGHVYPASHTAGSSAGALPMGARLRLKASTNLSGYPADVLKILVALQKYGMIVADNGSDMFIQGSYDNNWNMDIFTSTSAGLAKLTANDFEVVQLGWQPPSSFILSMPSVMGAGDTATGTLTAYDTNNAVATGYRGTVHFTTTDGSATLPSDYTFTAADNGAHAFAFTLRTVGGQTIRATDASNAAITCSRIVIVGPNTPTALTATATSATNVNLTWNPSTGMSLQYEVQRASSAGGGYLTVTTTSSTSFPDSTVSGGAMYAYRVRAIDTSMRYSPFSVADAATTIAFADDPLASFGTAIKGGHVTDLRAAVNLLRNAAVGIGAFSFTDPSLSSVTIKLTHLQQLRTALAGAQNALGLPQTNYTNPSPSAIKAIDLQELRSALK